MYARARLTTDNCNTEENAEAQAFLESNNIPFTLNYGDVLKPVLSIGQTAYYGVEQIRNNLNAIKAQLRD